MAMRVRREVLRTIKNQTNPTYIVEMSEELADYIASKNNINKPILPLFDDKRFYMRTIKNVHPEFLKVYAVTDKSMLSGTQMFL
jgi:ribonuclease G